LIPYAAAIRIRNEHCQGRQTWIIPFWLTGLLLLPVGILLMPLILVVCAVTRLNPFPILHALWQIFVSLKGTIVDVDDPQFSVSVHVS
jgi:hypothetical protein